MKIWIVTNAPTGAYTNDLAPSVSVFNSKEEAEDEYLRNIDPDIAEAYATPEAEREEREKEDAESAAEYLKDWAHYGDGYVVSIDEKEVEAPKKAWLVVVDDHHTDPEYLVASTAEKATEMMKTIIENNYLIDGEFHDEYGRTEEQCLKEGSWGCCDDWIHISQVNVDSYNFVN